MRELHLFQLPCEALALLLIFRILYDVAHVVGIDAQIVELLGGKLAEAHLEKPLHALLAPVVDHPRLGGPCVHVPITQMGIVA